MTGEIAAKRYLIRGGRIYDHEGDIHQPATADVLIRGGSIERIAPHLVADDGVEVLEAAGKLVIPGFVNAHYHSHDVMAKGLFEELPFDLWMMHANPKSFGRRSHEEVRVRTLIGAAESLRNGITTMGWDQHDLHAISVDVANAHWLDPVRFRQLKQRTRV